MQSCHWQGFWCGNACIDVSSFIEGLGSITSSVLYSSLQRKPVGSTQYFVIQGLMGAPWDKPVSWPSQTMHPYLETAGVSPDWRPHIRDVFVDPAKYGSTINLNSVILVWASFLMRKWLFAPIKTRVSLFYGTLASLTFTSMSGLLNQVMVPSFWLHRLRTSTPSYPQEQRIQDKVIIQFQRTCKPRVSPTVVFRGCIRRLNLSCGSSRRNKTFQ